jgi:hypothetical protein
MTGAVATQTERAALLLCLQEAYMRSQGLTAKDYSSFSRADQGVMAAHRWFDAAGYQEMWQQRMGPGAAGGAAVASAAVGNGEAATSSSVTNDSLHGSGQQHTTGARYALKPFTTAADESDYFNFWQRHTRHCKECQQGLKLVETAVKAAAVAAAVSVALAAAAAAAAKTVVCPGTLLGLVLAGACVWLRLKLQEFKHTHFINSRLQWQKDGGLSLVKGDPIKLY